MLTKPDQAAVRFTKTRMMSHLHLIMKDCAAWVKVLLLEVLREVFMLEMDSQAYLLLWLRDKGKVTNNNLKVSGLLSAGVYVQQKTVQKIRTFIAASSEMQSHWVSRNTHVQSARERAWLNIRKCFHRLAKYSLTRGCFMVCGPQSHT